jgi:hypothetical protein
MMLTDYSIVLLAAGVDKTGIRPCLVSVFWLWAFWYRRLMA